MKPCQPLAFFKSMYRHVSLRLFGNTIGLKINLLYGIYATLLRMWVVGFTVRSSNRDRDDSEDHEHMVGEIRERGFAKLKPVLSAEHIRGVTRKVDALMAKSDRTVRTLEDGGLIRLKSPLVEIPELESFLLHPAVAAVLRRYFGGHFKVFSCDVYRTLPRDPTAAAEQFGSLKWHFDNCPSALFKVMVYLTDTTVDTGAISLVPKIKSLQLKRCGFWERDRADNFTAQIEQNAVYLEGVAGTILFFSTHYCIHKATLPTYGHRDVAVFLVQPSFTAQGTFSSKDRERFSSNFGYCVNPFLGTPLRYGDE